jgi:hypothetical protein
LLLEYRLSLPTCRSVVQIMHAFVGRSRLRSCISSLLPCGFEVTPLSHVLQNIFIFDTPRRRLDERCPKTFNLQAAVYCIGKQFNELREGGFRILAGTPIILRFFALFGSLSRRMPQCKYLKLRYDRSLVHVRY